MRRHTKLSAGAAAFTLLLGLSACSSTDGGSAADGDGATSAPSTSASGKPETSDSSDEDDALDLGLLEDYLGVGAGVGATVSDAESREYAEAIARCMASEGFEYVPWVDTNTEATFLPDGTITIEAAEPSFPDLPRDEFAARFGYGISTKSAAAQKEEKDPNEAIVARMSVAERVAYHQAMYGKAIGLDNQGYIAGNSMSSTDNSCTGRASAGEPTTEELASIEKRAEKVRDSFASLLKRVRDLREAKMTDPRVTAATSTWSSCMTASGQPGFTALEQPRARALDDARRLLGQDLLGADGADPTKLADLRKTEVELAVADEQCLGDWRETYKAVERDLEEQFVSDNVAELEEFRTAMSAAVADQD
jgi:hypothetical protein